MVKFDLSTGPDVWCQDGVCGKVQKVVIDPETEAITDLIVRHGFLLAKDRVVPAYLVRQATEDEIYLNISRDQLESYPEYQEDEVQVPPPDWQWEQARRADEAQRYGTRYGLAFREKLMPMIDDPNELLRYRKMLLEQDARRDSPSAQPPDR
jgi:hypothetical protein